MALHEKSNEQILSNSLFNKFIETQTTWLVGLVRVKHGTGRHWKIQSFFVAKGCPPKTLTCFYFFIKKQHSLNAWYKIPAASLALKSCKASYLKFLVSSRSMF